ncbi:MAG: hypothetical protein CJBNEKGG_02986 [Prosthecobacter sp.]|nr:hypothetical protein [Prosthecobacter sp.]
MALLSLVHGVTPFPLEKQGHLIQRTSIHKPWVEMNRPDCLQDPDGVPSCSPGVDAQRPLLGGACFEDAWEDPIGVPSQGRPWMMRSHRVDRNNGTPVGFLIRRGSGGVPVPGERSLRSALLGCMTQARWAWEVTRRIRSDVETCKPDPHAPNSGTAMHEPPCRYARVICHDEAVIRPRMNRNAVRSCSPRVPSEARLPWGLRPPSTPFAFPDRNAVPSGADAWPWGRPGDGVPMGFVIGDRGGVGAQVLGEHSLRSALLGFVALAR